METISLSDLTSILLGLKNKNESTRSKSIDNLYKHIAQISQEIYGDTYHKYMADVTRALSLMIHSHDNHEKTSSILAIERLIDIDEEPLNKIHRYADLLRTTLPSNDPHISLLSSRALGKLAIQGGLNASELVEAELSRCLNWVHHEKNENKRHGAVLLILELIRSVPNMIFGYLADIFECVWLTILENRVSIVFHHRVRFPFIVVF